MRSIPARLKDLLERMPRMRMCEAKWSGRSDCYGRIEWHHVFEYEGRQINEHWAILGTCELHHREVKTNRAIKEMFERRSLEIASSEDLAKYPKRDWLQLKKYLKHKRP